MEPTKAKIRCVLRDHIQRVAERVEWPDGSKHFQIVLGSGLVMSGPDFGHFNVGDNIKITIERIEDALPR